MKRQLIIYDFEVVRSGFWCVTFALPEENKIVQIWDDRDELREFYEAHRTDVFCGFNVKHYDKWIFAGILAGFDPWKINEWIITEKRQGFEFSDALNFFPIITFDTMAGYRTSLKELEGHMGVSIEESKVDFNTLRPLTEDEIEDMLFYNKHDVLQTMQLMLERHLTGDTNDFMPKLALINRFKKPIEWLSKTSANLTESILGCVRQEHDDMWDFDIPDTLDIDKYRAVLNWYKNPENHYEDAFLAVTVAGLPTVFRWGGVHGCPDEPMMYEGELLDIDVTFMKHWGYSNALNVYQRCA